MKISCWRRHALIVEDGSFSHKIDFVLHYWFKSYGNIAEWVDFDYWWSCIGKGLRADCEAGLFKLGNQTFNPPSPPSRHQSGARRIFFIVISPAKKTKKFTHKKSSFTVISLLSNLRLALMINDYIAELLEPYKGCLKRNKAV